MLLTILPKKIIEVFNDEGKKKEIQIDCSLFYEAWSCHDNNNKYLYTKTHTTSHIIPTEKASMQSIQTNV